MYYQLCITCVMYPTYYQYVIKVRLLNMSTKLTSVRKQNKMVFPKPSCTGTKKKTLSILREAKRGWSHWVQKVCVWLHAECMSHATVANNHWTGLFECTSYWNGHWTDIFCTKNHFLWPATRFSCWYIKAFVTRLPATFCLFWLRQVMIDLK